MKAVIGGWLDVNDHHPELYGEAILLRDLDGVGFALGLKTLQGKYVRVTIETVLEETREYPFTGEIQ